MNKLKQIERATREVNRLRAEYRKAKTTLNKLLGLNPVNPYLSKGKNELAFVAKYGRRCRLQARTIALCGLKGTREEMIAKFARAIESGQIVRTVTGWQKGKK